MNYKLSKHALDVISSRCIKTEWIDFVLEKPSLVDKISTKETHCFATIENNDNRCLKVVINPSSGIIVTAYFDRNMKKKGCR